MEVVTMVATLAGVFLLSLLLIWPRVVTGEKKPREAPVVSGRWPIIGHILKLGGQAPLPVILGNLADKYGPIFTIWIGLRRVVVISGWELAKEVYTTHDKKLADRPILPAGNYLGYNFAVLGFTPYGPTWREIRKVATVELLSARQIDLLKHVRGREVHMSVKDLYTEWTRNGNSPVKVEMKRWMGDMAFNNVVMSVAGKRYFGTNVVEDVQEARKFRDVTDEIIRLMGLFVPSDAFPMLERLDIGGFIKEMKAAWNGMDYFMQLWLDEHRRKKLANPNHVDQDFLDVMISTMNKFEFANHDIDTIIKATVATMYLGGADTVWVALVWCISTLMNNPRVVKKIQEELDAQVGKDRPLNESDLRNLPYLAAVIKESLRMHPSAPLAIPHYSMEDCTVGGYLIPKGTRVFINVQKLQRDPRLYDNPMEFRPERFLVPGRDEWDVKGQHFGLLPFGAGRRMCPGHYFAVLLMQLTIGRLLQAFDVAKTSDEPVDMTEAIGVTPHKRDPIEILVTPRLAADVYLREYETYV